MDHIFPGQLRLWKKMKDWYGGRFVVVDIKEKHADDPDEEPEIVVECLVEDGATDEYSIDEVIMGSKEFK